MKNNILLLGVIQHNKWNVEISGLKHLLQKLLHVFWKTKLMGEKQTTSTIWSNQGNPWSLLTAIITLSSVRDPDLKKKIKQTTIYKCLSLYPKLRVFFAPHLWNRWKPLQKNTTNQHAELLHIACTTIPKVSSTKQSHT